MSERGLTAADRRRSLIATYGAAAAFGFTFGLSSPLLSLILESRQVGSSVIGLNGAMTALGFLASAPVIPFLIRKFGVMRFITTRVSLATLTLLFLRAVDDLSIWFPLRFLFGVALNGLLLISETWINQIADGASRGRAIGIYVTVLAAAFALGPIIIPLTGTEGWTPFLIGAAVIMASAFAFLPVRRIAPKFDDHQTVAVLSFFRVAPTLMAAVAGRRRRRHRWRVDRSFGCVWSAPGGHTGRRGRHDFSVHGRKRLATNSPRLDGGPTQRLSRSRDLCCHRHILWPRGRGAGAF